MWLASSFVLAFSFVIASAAPQADGSDLLTEAEQAMFTKGQALHNQGLYSEAEIILNQFLELYPNSAIKDLGLLWLCRSYLAQGDLANAESIGLRLKAIPDTAMISIYEEELRVARQNYVRSATPSRTQTNLAVNKPVPLAASLVPPTDTAKTPTRIIEAAASGAAIEEKHPVAIQSAPSVSKVKDSAPPQTAAVKESATSGLFLPPALEIPTGTRGGVSGSINIRPLTVVAAPPKSASPKELSNKPLSTTSQRVAEQQSVKSPSAQSTQVIPSSNKVMVASPKDSGAAKAGSPVDVPILRVRIEEVPRPGSNEGTVSYRLIIANEGTGIARDLTVRSELDAGLDYAASDPSPIRRELIAQKQVLTFRLSMVQPGETKVLQIAVRLRRTGSTNIANQTKHSVFYRDSKGNLLHTP
jgi:hypothetical protein